MHNILKPSSTPIDFTYCKTFAEHQTKSMPWPEFVATIAEPRAYKTKEQSLKRGAIIGGVFDDESRSREDNVSQRTIITLDYDDMEGITTREIRKSLLENLDCAFCAYSTFSHTPENPRIRVVIPLSRPVDRKEHRFIVSTIDEILSIGNIDNCSFVMNQLMFLASVQDLGEFWYLINPMPGSDNSADIPFLDADEFLKEHGFVGKLTRSNEPSDLEVMINTKPLDLTEEQVNIILSLHQPSDLEYDEWLETGMALYHQFAGSVDGYDVWKSWSKLSEKYDETFMPTKWQSFAPTGSQSPVTMGTIIYRIGGMREVVARQDDPVFNDYVYIRSIDKFFNVKNGDMCSKQGFDITMNRHVPIVIDAKGKEKQRPASDYFTNVIRGASVQSEMYFPFAYDPNIPVFHHKGSTYVNSYVPTSVPETNKNWRQSHHWKVIENHIKNILPEDWQIILAWMAHNVQKPGDKIRWMPLIKGVQGDGKTTFERILSATMGSRHVKNATEASINSDFTGWATDAAVVALEEIRTKGHSRYNVVEKMKPFITNDVVEIVKKGRDGVNVPNTTNFIAFTNHEDAIAIDLDDRRWYVTFTRFETRQQMLSEIPQSYWDEIYDAIQNHAPELRGWLLDQDTSAISPNWAPENTKHKLRMIELSVPDDFSEAAEVIDSGGVGITKDVVLGPFLKDELMRVGIRLNTRRVQKAMEYLGYTSLDQKLMWRGKASRIYVHKSRKDLIGYPDEVNHKIREILDEETLEDFE